MALLCLAQLASVLCGTRRIELNERRELRILFPSSIRFRARGEASARNSSRFALFHDLHALLCPALHHRCRREKGKEEDKDGQATSWPARRVHGRNWNPESAHLPVARVFASTICLRGPICACRRSPPVQYQRQSASPLHQPARPELCTAAPPGFCSDPADQSLVLFFSISCVFELLCALLYTFVFPTLQIVKYYRSKAATEGSKTVAGDLAAAGIPTECDEQADQEDPEGYERLSSKQLLLQNMDYALDIFLIYVLTLSIFPGFLSEDTGSHSLGAWFALSLIAMYNVWELIRRYAPFIVKVKSRKCVMGAALARFLLAPAFYFTAKYGDQGYMIVLTSFLGLSNGYLTVCVLTEAPKGYKGPEQNALGNVLVVFILIGLFTGAVLDWLWLIGMGW